MVRHLEAVYEGGVLRPLEPLALGEHQRVRLTVEEPETEAIHERQAELRCLAEESSAYAGEWVALEGSRVVAHGVRLAEVQESAAAEGVAEPFYARVPGGKQIPFGGW